MENKITARAQKVLLAKVKNQDDVDCFFFFFPKQNMMHKEFVSEVKQ
jgi:hypothetical protein